LYHKTTPREILIVLSSVCIGKKVANP